MIDLPNHVYIDLWHLQDLKDDAPATKKPKQEQSDSEDAPDMIPAETKPRLSKATSLGSQVNKISQPAHVHMHVHIFTKLIYEVIGLPKKSTQIYVICRNRKMMHLRGRGRSVWNPPAPGEIRWTKSRVQSCTIFLFVWRPLTSSQFCSFLSEMGKEFSDVSTRSGESEERENSGK